MNAQQKVAKALEALVIDQRFYGTLIYATKIVATEQVGGEDIDTMATDGKCIYYNPRFVDTLTLGEVKGVLCHEVMHIANGHNYRRGDRDHYLWNVACDYAINPLILASKMMLPKDCLLEPAYAGKSAEEIYLREKAKQDAMNAQAQAPVMAVGAGQGNGLGDDTQDQPEASGEADNGQEGDNNGASQSPGAKPKGDAKPRQGHPSAGLVLDATDDKGQPLSEADKQEALKDIQVQIIQAAQIAVSAGQNAGGFDRLVEEAKNPRDDWKEVLRRFIQQSVETPSDVTWSRPNRRHLSNGDYMPGRRKEDLGTLLVAIDTSGSVDGIMLGRFVAEMKVILEDTEYETVTVMACDTKVNWHGTFAKGEEVEYKLKGGGGTRFFPIWEKAEELNLKPKACIYFTDLMCYAFGDEPGYPVLWAKWGDDNRKPPFGEVTQVAVS